MEGTFLRSGDGGRESGNGRGQSRESVGVANTTMYEMLGNS